MKRIVLALCLVLGVSATASAATKKVCASGCDYDNSHLQQALNEIVAGDILLLQEGITYTGDFTLPVKSGASSSAITTIRTGVSSVGVVQLTTRYTATDVRICPSTYVGEADPIDGTIYTCATRSPQDMTRIAKLKPSTNNAYALRTAATGTGTPVSYYTIQWLEFIPNSFAGNSLIGILNDTTPANTGTVAQLPHDFIFDRVVIRGDSIIGQFRGFQGDGAYITIKNSFIYDIKAQGEGQALWFNGPGPVTVLNNYINCGTECMLTGGSGTRPNPLYTVQTSPSTSTTTFALDRVTDLYVGKTVAVYEAKKIVSTISAANPAVVTTTTANGYSDGYQVYLEGMTGCTSTWFGVPFTITVLSSTTFSIPTNCSTSASGGIVRIRASAELTAIVGTTVTVTPALPFAPEVLDEVKSSIVLANYTVQKNYITRPPSHRTVPIQPPPTSVIATPAASGGTLAAGTHTYRVMARLITAQFATANSGATVAVNCATTGATSKCTIDWTAAANATDYVVYRTDGTPQYWVVTAPTVQYVDTGTAGTAGSVWGDIADANKWQVKNTFEMKVGIHALIEGNFIENSWQAGQNGPLVLWTGTQQNIDGTSAINADILFRNNIVRHGAQAFQITGRDALGHEGGRSGGITLSNNLVYDVGMPYGFTYGWIVSAGGGPRQYPDRSTYDLTIDHLTLWPAAAGAYSHLLFSNCEDSPPGLTPSHESLSVNTDITNSILRGALSSIDNANPNCNIGIRTGRIGLPYLGPLGAGSQVSTTVLADGTSSLYTASATGMFFPTLAAVESGTFTSITSPTGFQVKVTSPYYHAGTDGLDIGADISLITPLTDIAWSGDNSGGGGGDVTTPSVAITAPVGGTTVSGSSVSVTASASDNVAVVGVQFKLDGVNLSGEDLIAPYAIVWDSTTATAGSHSLTAVARDAAGNSTTSATVTVTTGTAPAGYSATIVANTPNGFWKFSEPSGTTAVNSSGSAPDGIYGGSPALAQAATPLSGDSLTSVLMDGVDDYVIVADSPYVDATGDFSLEIWFKTASLPDANARIFWKRAGGVGYGFHMTTSTGFLTFELETGSVNTQLNTTVTSYKDGAWHHAVATRSGSSGRIYVDGALVAGPTTLTGADLSNALNFYIGTNDAVTRRFSGNLFGAAFYPTALSATDIASHYAAKGDQTLPVVTVTAPLTGAAVSGAAVSVTATASDNVGVVGVQFKLDGVNLGAEDLTSAYGITWDSTTASTGTHSITAVARDAAGNTTTSPAITVTTGADTTVPSVTITAPTNGAAVSGALVAFTATVTDNIAVASVQFKADGANIGPAQTVAPYATTWASTSVSDGPHQLAVTAFDTAGNAANAYADVTVSNSPSVAITAPASGAIITGGSSVDLTATASDAGGVVGVQFKLDGVNLGAEDTVEPYAYTWNTTGVSSAVHSLTAVARDATGNSTTSDAVLVTVQNVSASGTITRPNPVTRTGTATRRGTVTMALIKGHAAVDLNLTRGETFSVQQTLSPVEDITGWTIIATVKKTLATTDAAFTSTAVLTTPASGVFTFTFTAAQTALLTEGRWVWDVWRTNVGFEAPLMAPSVITVATGAHTP